MPHKRAKKSARDLEQKRRQERGEDHAPNSQSESGTISKRALWVLEAEKVRSEFRERKKRIRNGEEVEQQPTPKKRRKSAPDTAAPKILPGESLAQFNKRVEDDLRPTVRTAIKTSLNNAKNAHRKPKKPAASEAEAEDDDTKPSEPTSIPKRRMTKTEFDARPRSTRLNDIALAPPTLSKATRKAPDRLNGGGTGTMLTTAQKEEMEVERERVIRRYRELKEKQQGERRELSGKGRPITVPN